MKGKYLFFLFLLALIYPHTGYAQGEVTAIDSLIVDLWPDYDRASVLVLLTGTLPASTSLPASVTLPLPETAKLNAVARIDQTDGKMKDDVISTPAPGKITFITPDPRFRVEYYLPYTVSDNRHTFDFTWLADLSVNSFRLTVQRPASASSFSTEPPTTSLVTGQDGLSYGFFPAKALPVGQSFSVHVDYTMRTARLSVESLSSSTVPGQEPEVSSTSDTGAGTKWAIVAVAVFGIILLIVVVWRIASHRAMSKRPATRRVKAKKKSSSKFCPNCGNKIGKEDKYCSECGASLTV